MIENITKFNDGTLPNIDIKYGYDKAEIDEKLLEKADKLDTYTKTEVDEKVANIKPDLTDYYKKQETYNKQEVDDKVANIKVPEGVITEEILATKDFATNAGVDAKIAQIPTGETYDDTAITGRVTALENAGYATMGEVEAKNYAKKVTLTQSEYDQLVEKDANTVYEISDAAPLNIPTKTSELTNDSNFLTEIPAEYVTETELTQKGYLTEVPAETLDRISALETEVTGAAQTVSEINTIIG